MPPGGGAPRDDVKPPEHPCQQAGRQEDLPCRPAAARLATT